MSYHLGAGRIVETGRHDELLARGGLYARLYQSQQEQGLPRSPDVETPAEEMHMLIEKESTQLAR